MRVRISGIYAWGIRQQAVVIIGHVDKQRIGRDRPDATTYSVVLARLIAENVVILSRDPRATGHPNAMTTVIEGDDVVSNINIAVTNQSYARPPLIRGVVDNGVVDNTDSGYFGAL